MDSAELKCAMLYTRTLVRQRQQNSGEVLS